MSDVTVDDVWILEGHKPGGYIALDGWPCPLGGLARYSVGFEEERLSRLVLTEHGHRVISAVHLNVTLSAVPNQEPKIMGVVCWIAGKRFEAGRIHSRDMSIVEFSDGRLRVTEKRVLSFVNRRATIEVIQKALTVFFAQFGSD